MGFRTVFNGTIVGVQYVQTQDGEFYYAGSPASGNLIASIAAKAGTDPYGNAYLAGIVSYDPLSFLRYVQLASGALELGSIGDSAALAATIATAFGAHTLGQLLLTCQTTAGAQTASVIDMRSGVTGSGVGSTNAPSIWLGTNDGAGNTAVQAFTAGPLALTTPGGTPYTWATPSYNTNWLTSTTFNSSTTNRPLEFRPDAEDNLVIGGAFKAGTTAPGATVFTLPATLRPNANYWVNGWRNRGGTVIPMGFQITSGGNFNVVATMGGGAPAANDEYWIPQQTVALGNLA